MDGSKKARLALRRRITPIIPSSANPKHRSRRCEQPQFNEYTPYIVSKHKLPAIVIGGGARAVTARPWVDSECDEISTIAAFEPQPGDYVSANGKRVLRSIGVPNRDPLSATFVTRKLWVGNTFHLNRSKDRMSGQRFRLANSVHHSCCVFRKGINAKDKRQPRTCCVYWNAIRPPETLRPWHPEPIRARRSTAAHGVGDGTTLIVLCRVSGKIAASRGSSRRTSRALAAVRLGAPQIFRIDAQQGTFLVQVTSFQSECARCFGHVAI
jgi:hypothetical protein